MDEWGFKIRKSLFECRDKDKRKERKAHLKVN